VFAAGIPKIELPDGNSRMVFIMAVAVTEVQRAVDHQANGEMMDAEYDSSLNLTATKKPLSS
jgi:hypothetical protein